MASIAAHSFFLVTSLLRVILIYYEWCLDMPSLTDVVLPKAFKYKNDITTHSTQTITPLRIDISQALKNCLKVPPPVVSKPSQPSYSPPPTNDNCCSVLSLVSPIQFHTIQTPQSSRNHHLFFDVPLEANNHFNTQTNSSSSHMNESTLLRYTTHFPSSLPFSIPVTILQTHSLKTNYTMQKCTTWFQQTHK